MRTTYKSAAWKYLPAEITQIIAGQKHKCVAFAPIYFNREIKKVADEMGVIACECWNGSYHAACAEPYAAVVARRFSTAKKRLRKFLKRIEEFGNEPILPIKLRYYRYLD